MKRIISCTLCVALLLCCLLTGTVLSPTVTAATPNLLVGGDFEWETASGHWASPNAGYAVVGGTSLYTVVTDSTDSTNRCLQLPEGSHANRFLSDVPLAGGKVYRLSGRARGAGAAFYFRSNEINEAGNHYPLGSATATSETWVDFSFEFTTKASLAAGKYSFAIAIGHGATAAAYLDDISLCEVVETTGIAFADGSDISLSIGEAKQLTLIGAPDGADLPSGTAAWTSSDTSIATVNNGTVTAVSYGITQITATLGGYSATCTVSVSEYAPVLLGDFEGELSPNWAWDNPTYGMINDSSPMSIATEDNGNHCLKIPALPNADNTGYTFYNRAYKNMPVVPDTTYRITMKYKGSGAGLYLMSNMIATGAGVHRMESEEWKTYSCTFTTKSGTLNTAFVMGFWHYGDSDGTLYVDDIVLSVVTPFDDMIVDGDFEAESLSANWNSILQYTPTSPHPSMGGYVEHVDETADNRCLKFTGKNWMNYLNLSVQANSSYRMSFRAKGSGRLIFDFNGAVIGSQVVTGAATSDLLVSSRYVYITLTNEWKDYTITFQSKDAVNGSYFFFVGGADTTGAIYVDDLSMIRLGTAYLQSGIANGTVALAANGESGKLLSDLHDGTTGQTVTVTVTPDDGYVLVPGSLKYTTDTGMVKRVLNKDTGDFGEGAGNTFAFEMPNANVSLFAEFVSTENTDFAWGTVGTAVHTNDEGVNDGIRFLNRIQLQAFQPDADGYTVTYDGETYTISKVGLLIKRKELNYSLDLETYDLLMHDATDVPVKMWGVSVYDKAANVFRAVDYTASYVDFSVALITTAPDEDFYGRIYVARSYIVLEKDGVETVIYSEERADSVDSTVLRLEGKLSDDAEVSDSVVSDPSTPIPEDSEALKNADLKVLTIGNSWSHNAHSYLADVAAASGKTFKCVNLFKSGCSLEGHHTGWKNNLPQYWYELNGTIDWSSAVTLKAVLESDTWDVITLHAGPAEPVTADSYQPYLNELVAMLKAAQPKAKICLMQTWALGDDYAYLNASTGYSRAEMWSKVEPAYEQVIAETGLSVIPAGTAANSLENWFEENAPELSFYQADDSHAEETWGWYLLALVWYRSLTGEEPANTFAAFDKSYTDDAEIRAKVFEIAMAAVEEFYPVSEEVAA